MLATMSQHAEMSPLTWSLSELLPTGTVTLLLADVEVSTRLWETQPEQMTAALAVFNRTVNETVAAHDGMRPVEQGEGDSFVAVFARASDAVACALVLQRAPLAPIKLLIGLAHSARSSCATRVTTRVRRSIARRACAIWRMVARPCCRARRSRWWGIDCLMVSG